MAMKIERVKTFSITAIPESPGSFYFDFVDKNNGLTRVIVEIDPSLYDPDKIIHMGKDWSNLIKAKKGVDLADAFKRLHTPHDKHSPGRS